MREIKFRAWDVVLKKMLPIACLYFDERSDFVGIYIGDEENDEWTVIKSEHIKLMQYTGLKDKNGVEIYEGDIVYAYTAESNGYGKDDYISAEIEGVVTYKGISFGIQVDNIFNDLWINAETFKVIGNIYENPEILEVSNNV